MVSKASELFPEPDTPLTTVSLPCGISQDMFFRLWVRAPRITMASFKGKGTRQNSAIRNPAHSVRARAQTAIFHYRSADKRARAGSAFARGHGAAPKSARNASKSGAHGHTAPTTGSARIERHQAEAQARSPHACDA